MITVLVTGVGGGVGQGVLKCLRRMDDLELRIIAADMSALAPGLYTADAARLVPAAADPKYVDKLVALCRTESVDFYIPGTDIELRVCAAARARFLEVGTDCVVSPSDVIEIADDKYATFAFLRDHGLSHPRTWKPAELSSVELPFPVIVKPRVGFRSIGVHRVNDAAALAPHLSGDVVVQEVAGPDDREFTCTIVGVAGELSPVVVLRRDLRSGDTYRAFSVAEPVIAKYVRDVATALGITASCNFQLRTGTDGVPRLFEINARFSGTTPFCAQLGLNPVEFYIKRARGLPCAPAVRTDVTVLRAWSEVVVDNEQIAALTEHGASEAPHVVARGIL